MTSMESRFTSAFYTYRRGGVVIRAHACSWNACVQFSCVVIAKTLKTVFIALCLTISRKGSVGKKSPSSLFVSLGRASALFRLSMRLFRFYEADK